MNKSDYDKYYKKGGTYVIPVEIFNELFDELERLSFNYEQALEDLDKKENIIKEVREYIEDNKEYTLIEKSSNQDFKGIPTFYYTNEDILNQEMIEKLLEILDKEGDIK